MKNFDDAIFGAFRAIAEPQSELSSSQSFLNSQDSISGRFKDEEKMAMAAMDIARLSVEIQTELNGLGDEMGNTIEDLADSLGFSVEAANPPVLMHTELLSVSYLVSETRQLT